MPSHTPEERRRRRREQRQDTPAQARGTQRRGDRAFLDATRGGARGAGGPNLGTTPPSAVRDRTASGQRPRTDLSQLGAVGRSAQAAVEAAPRQLPEFQGLSIGQPTSSIGLGAGATGQPRARGRQRRGTGTQPLSDLNRGALEASRRATDLSQQGFATGPDGQTRFFEGTQRVPDALPGVRGPSVVGDFGAAAEEFARANAIRQQQIDAQRPQNQVTIIPDSGAQGQRTQVDRIASALASERDPQRRAALNSQLRALQGQQELDQAGQIARERGQTTLEAARLGEEGALQRALLEQQQGPSGTDAFNALRAQQLQQQIAREQAGIPSEDPEFPTDAFFELQQTDPALADRLVTNFSSQLAARQLSRTLGQEGLTFQEGLQAFREGQFDDLPQLAGLFEEVLNVGGPQENFAGGGLVGGHEMSAIGYQDGGFVDSLGPRLDQASAMGMNTPTSNPVNLLRIEFDEFARGAQRLGVDPIPFEQFVELRQQSIPQAPEPQPQVQGVLGLQAGGPVPGGNDVSGMMVVDPDPNAPTDSIPAVIDGQRPAALDSGEFVIPREAVMFHGIDKLNKLIAQALQQGQENGAETRAAGATSSAIRSA